jgi:monoamine oxidase
MIAMALLYPKIDATQDGLWQAERKDPLARTVPGMLRLTRIRGTDMTVSRRRILGGAAALSLAGLPGRAAPQAELDVAIIGGGVAGSYAAWRLRGEQPGLRVRLFEMSERIGGRLRSVAFPQAPHLVGEVGGMRFLQSQKHVFNLVKHLNLPARGYPITLPQNRLALRGRSFSIAEMGQPTKLYPYNIPASDQSPKSDLFFRGMERIVQGSSRMTSAQWRKIRATVRYKGRLLKDWAAWVLLADVFTLEEMRFMQDSSGYDDVSLFETGLDQFDFILLGDDESKPFFTLAGGYQRLPLALAEEAKRFGAGVEMQTRLASLVLPGTADGFFHLGLRNRKGTNETITAKRVVLALPRRAIEAIPDFPAARQPQFAALIASVESVPACKALLLYPKPWWRDQGIAAGRSVTDMPSRQLYALGAEKERLPIEPTNGFGILMMYCDANTVEYWKELAPGAQPDAAGFQWLAGDSQLASEIHREASLVYQTAPPKPLAACFQDWTAGPYGGGWHFWGAGKDGFALADRVMKPIADHELYICGEAYTMYEAGWVEGAIERAETMLQRHFGMKPPGWLA